MSTMYDSVKREKEALALMVRTLRSQIAVFSELIEAEQQAQARLYELLRRATADNEDLQKDVLSLHAALRAQDTDDVFAGRAVDGPETVA